MPREFWKRGNLTKWQWFWSRLALVCGFVWISGMIIGLVLLVVAFVKQLMWIGAALSITAYVAWCCGGVCICWACLVLGGFTVMGHPDPWKGGE